jgi:hypothetical protein
MASLLKRVLEEHPTSKGLKVMNLVYLRIVFNDKHSAAWFEKLAKLGTAELPLDLKYTLYAGAPPCGFASLSFLAGPLQQRTRSPDNMGSDFHEFPS